MSNYSKTTDFAAKDSLPSGDSGKIIRGSEFETEFDNIATAIATKADAADPTFTGTVTIDGLTVNGNTTLGNAATDTVTVTADIASNLIPSADDTYNLGASGAEWNNLFIDGTANIDSLVADTADINGGTIDGVTIGGSSAGAITGTTITGTSFVTSGNMTFGDNDKAIFGASSDLQIYHDSSNGTSVITESGGGDLLVRGSNLRLQSPTGDNYFVAINGGASNVYHGGSVKLATTSTGVDVTGTVTADGLTVQGESYFDTNNGSRALHITRYGTVESESANFTIDDNDLIVDSVQDEQYGGYVFKATRNGVGTVNRLAIENNGDISFYEDTGTTAKFFWDASAERLGIGTVTPADILDVSNGWIRTTSGYGIRFGGTANSIYGSNTSNVVAITTNGSEAMRIDSAGNVGIGTSSPSKKLHILGSTITGATADTNTLLYLEQNANNSIQINSGASNNGQIRFGDSSSNYRGAITYQHSDDSLQFVSAGSERMRIDSSGNVGIGTDSPSANLEVSSATGSASPTATELRIGSLTVASNWSTTDPWATLGFYSADTSGGGAGNLAEISANMENTSGGFGSLDFKLQNPGDSYSKTSWLTLKNSAASAQRRVDIEADGGLYVENGAYLGGTAAANLLDDYEEGSFTPVIADASSGGNTGTATTATGRYTKIGNRVFVQVFLFDIDTTGMTGANTFIVRDMPFTSSTGNSGAIGATQASSTTFTGYVNAFLGSSRTYLYFRDNASGLGGSNITVSDLTSGSADLYFTLSYEAA